jgi:hypothetical protein
MERYFKKHPGGSAALIGTIVLTASQLFARDAENRLADASRALKDCFGERDEKLQKLFSANPGKGTKPLLFHAAKQFVEAKAPTYASADGDVSMWARQLVHKFFSDREAAMPTRKAAPGGAAAGGAAAGSAAVGAAAPAPAQPKRSLWSNFLTRRIIQFCCHVFKSDGSHDHWVTAEALAAAVTSKLELPDAISAKTSEVWLRKEKEVRNGQGFCRASIDVHLFEVFRRPITPNALGSLVRLSPS